MKHTSALAVNPCPTDLLGRQQVFMHMSAHYRRTYSAQSVVDTAPPASLLAKKERAERARSSKPIRMYSKPSRAETDPGRVSTRRPLDYGCAGAGNTSVPRKSAGTPRLRRREHDKSATFYDKLSQIQPGPGRMPRTRTNSELLAESLTPGAPHKPRVLRTEVPSRLRSSNNYCPPRPKASLRTKLEELETENYNNASTDPQAVWPKPFTSPPVSSRDSAYNGGISSGGESRGPTPDHKNDSAKSPFKKSDKKSVRKRSDGKKTHLPDSKTRKRLEKRLKKKLLEDEREEMQGQRIHAGTWRSVPHQDDHGDEIPSAEGDLYHDSPVEDYDDSFIEDETPSNDKNSSQTDDGSKSDQSVEEEVEEENEEVESIEQSSEGREDTSDTTEVSTEKELVKQSITIPQQRESQSHANKVIKVQVGTQTESIIMYDLLKNSPRLDQRRSRGSSPRMVDNASQLSKSSISRSYSSSHSSKSPPSVISTAVSCSGGVKNQSEDDSPPLNQKGKYAQNENCGDRQIGLHPLFALDVHYEHVHDAVRSCDEPYIRLIHDITQDVCKRGVVTNKAVKAVFQEHLKANQGILDTTRMQQEVHKIYQQLNIPKDDDLDSTNYGMGSALDVKHLVALTVQCDSWHTNNIHPSTLKQKIEEGVVPSQGKELADRERLSTDHLKNIILRNGSKDTNSESKFSKSIKSSHLLMEKVPEQEVVSEALALLERENIKDIKGNTCVEEITYPEKVNPENLDAEEEHIINEQSFFSEESFLFKSLNDLKICSSYIPEVKTRGSDLQSLISSLNVEDKHLEGNSPRTEVMGMGNKVGYVTGEIFTSKENFNALPLEAEVLSLNENENIKHKTELPNAKSISSEIPKAYSRPHMDAKDLISSKPYVEPSCGCPQHCECTSDDKISKYFQSWESDIDKSLKLYASNSPSPLAQLAPCPDFIDSVHEDQSKHDCKCKQQSDRITEVKDIKRDGTRNSIKENDGVLTLLPPNENFASRDSMGEGPVYGKKIQTTNDRIDSQSGNVNDLVSCTYSGEQSSSPKVKYRVKPYDFDQVDVPLENVDFKTQHDSSLLMGTGVMSDILRWNKYESPNST